MQSNYIKTHPQEISFIGYNVIEFFYVPLYTNYSSDVGEKFELTFTSDTQVTYDANEIWNSI